MSAPVTAPTCAIQSSVARRSAPCASRMILRPHRYVNITVKADAIAETAFTRCATVAQGMSVAIRPSNT